MKSKLLKGLALLSFITLISAFLLYNAGYFDRRIEKSDDKPQPAWSMPLQENSTASFNSTQVDLDTLLPQERFSSSKSLIITVRPNSLPNKKTTRKDSLQREKEKVRMMSGSKSGLMFRFDSLIKARDTQKIEKKKQE